MMVRTSKAQKQKDIAHTPVKASFKHRHFEGFKHAKTFAKQKVASLRATAAALGIAFMISCTPAAIHAQDTVKRTPKEPTAAVESSDVNYQIISDVSEIEPYFKNAEGKMVTIKPGQVKKIGDYEVSIYSEGRTGVDFIVTVEGKKERHGVVFASPLSEVNILAVDMGKDHPVIKGTLLIFADNTTVYFQFFDKTLGAHSLAGVPLEKGRMREGPIKTGFGIDDNGIFVLNAPKDLKAGDVVCQATLENNGDSWGAAFKFIPPSEGSKTVALR